MTISGTSTRTGDKLLLALRLFTPERPMWTVEEAAAALGVSLSTAYRYFRSLGDAGLLDPVEAQGFYVLGPAVIEFDRTIRVSDPLLGASIPTMRWLADQTGRRGTLLLCRLYQEKVMCIHQERAAGVEQAISYERGRPMPMFRGAASKAILAQLPPRQLRRIFEKAAPEIEALGLGPDWKGFRGRLGAIRRAGVCISRGELDPGVIGISAPLFSPQKQVLGSLGLAIRDDLDEPAFARMRGLVIAGAREIEVAARRCVPSADPTGSPTGSSGRAAAE